MEELAVVGEGSIEKWMVNWEVGAGTKQSLLMCFTPYFLQHLFTPTADHKLAEGGEFFSFPYQWMCLYKVKIK